IEFGLDGIDCAFGFQSTGEHGLALAAQPIPGGHRRAVVEERFIAQHHGITVEGAHDDFESTLWGTTEEFGDASAIVRARRIRRRGHR
ncbi:MAG: hypothetical protein RLZ74_953, partial [Actinomycetota bacterium]